MTRDSNDFLGGYLAACQNLLVLHNKPTMVKDLLQESGFDREALIQEQEQQDFKTEKMMELIDTATEDPPLNVGYVDGQKVTHAYHTGGGWVLYHCPEQEGSIAPPEEELEPLNGWPDDWPRFVTGKWLERNNVAVI